ncbi:hypothetical protein RY831_21550 [Noviherbaspirillum sp. CPCC 100848]|uniref:Uncharacterized protein n=1 Tax=Noviherbaspirillum album TaxID=3080276 RepID=A0ABU6JEB1_9BURK|nr:hypothetical protein [Noviherbaspirillum sp. CPCC 100848]MEC4721758.1 hypothetical protein [Noviherbaspirillum sp. CPCC 100848]
MRILDNFLTRRRDQPRFSSLAPHVRQRLTLACRELSDAEQSLAGRLGLPRPPRLLMVDEEEAVILTPSDRADMV